MQPAGHTEIERAQGDGRWDAAYAGQATMEVPADLNDALAKEPRAKAMFEILTKQNRCVCNDRDCQEARHSCSPDRNSCGRPPEANLHPKTHLGRRTGGSAPRRSRTQPDG